MKKIFSLFSLSFMVLATAFGQADKKKQDVAAIKAMCGCYEVSFEYVETFAADTAYQKTKPYKTGALEWAGLSEETDGKISIQHILVINDTMTVKHWRQDWLFENQEMFNYQAGLTWNMEKLPKDAVKGQWTQKVYEVDDSPRYAGTATWVHYDGKHYWENTTNAPLPRREYTKRSDYQIMKRKNRQELTSYGWVHEQDNDKVVRAADGDRVLVQEKGWNKYKKVEDSRCKMAAQWWEKNKNFWAEVRQAWDKTLSEKPQISLQRKVNDKFLGEVLEDLSKKGESNKIVPTIQLYKSK